MWFKNARVYALDAGFPYGPEELDGLLAQRRFTGCTGRDTVSLGWASPLGAADGPLCHKVGGDWFLRCRIEKRNLPASVVAEELAGRIGELELARGRRVGRKERDELRERIVDELLPRAFRVHREHWVWISPARRCAAVGAASDKLAEDIVALLRQCLGSFPAKPFVFNRSVSECLTEWVAAGAGPAGVEIGEEAEFRADDGGSVKARNQDLGTAEIKACLEAGKVVTSLALAVNGAVALVVDDRFALKRIRLTDAEAGDGSYDGDPAARLDADLALIAGELGRLVSSLAAAFGGAGTGK